MPTRTGRSNLHAALRIFRIPMALALAFALLLPMLVAAPPAGVHRGDKSASDETARLRRRIKALLKDGRIDEAVRAAQAAMKSAPDNDAVRREFVDLHLSLARNWLSEEHFADAETALDAVLRARPGQPDATRLKQAIDAARRAIPARIRQAREWIGFEWYEPAFNAFRQAIALAPAHRDDWLRDYHAAAVGAADDDYLTKNFHQAFYYYDAALKLGDDADIPADPAIVSRWLQSLVHALNDDAHIRYPEAWWKLTFKRIADSRYEGPDAAALKSTLQGIAYEQAGDPRNAAQSYARALGPAARRSCGSIDTLRRAAIDGIRRHYEPESTGRRAGEWRRSDTDAPQLLESARFRIHHRNAVIAQRVARVLDFQFARIADTWALDLDEIPWSTKADIHLHPSRQAFYDATGQAPPVTAISRIRLEGSAVTEKVIHAHLEDPMLLSSSLAHELAHLMTAELRRDRPLPAVLTEGLALHVEPQCRHRQFARLFEQEKRPATVRRLLEFEDVHPTDAGFYCDAHRLMAVLRSRTTMADILELRGDPIDASRLARKCGFADKGQLQRVYMRMTEEPAPAAER